MNIRKRLVVLHTIILAGFLFIFTVGLYMALNYHLYAEVDGSLSAWADHTGESLDDGGLLFDGQVHSDTNHLIPHYNLLDSFVVLFSQNKKSILDRAVLEKNSQEKLQTFLATHKIPSTGLYATIGLKSQPFRVFSKLLSEKASDRRIIVLGRSLMHVQETLNGLKLTLILAWLLAVIVCTVISWVFVGWTLYPVKTMTADAIQIAASKESGRRINCISENDEFGHLANALNHMLTSLEASNLAMKKFLADSSHELRTPLTSIKTNLDFLKRATGAPEEIKFAALQETISETNRMNVLVNDLLMLARAEAPSSFIFDQVDLADIVNEVKSGFSVYQHESPKKMIYDIAEAAFIRGDREKLRQVIVILLDNAIKYTPPDGVIEIKLMTSKESVRLEIMDNGPGIPEDEIGMIFDRFFRASNVREKFTGSGLGLSIVRPVILNHGGIIRLKNNQPTGLIVTVTFPVSGKSGI